MEPPVNISNVRIRVFVRKEFLYGRWCVHYTLGLVGLCFEWGSLFKRRLMMV